MAKTKAKASNKGIDKGEGTDDKGKVERFKCKIVTWDEIMLWAKDTVDKMKAAEFKPDIVIGLTRGGWVPARIMCDIMHIKSLFSIKVEHWGITAQPDGQAKLIQGLDMDLKGKKVLVVDDITDTGKSMQLSKEHLLSKGPAELRTATLLHITHSVFEPDFYSVKVPKEDWTWFVFPWNFYEDMRTLVPKTLYERKDLEGVCCAMREQFQVNVDRKQVDGTLNELRDQDKVEVKDGKWSMK